MQKDFYDKRCVCSVLPARHEKKYLLMYGKTEIETRVLREYEYGNIKKYLRKSVPKMIIFQNDMEKIMQQDYKQFALVYFLKTE